MTRRERDSLVKMAIWIDAEGCIGIYRGYTGESISWKYTVTLCQSTKPKVDVETWMRNKQRLHGGSFGRRHNGGERKPSFQLTWTGRSAIRFLRSILPYLELKREQAETLLHADHEWPRNPNPGFAIPPEIIARRDQWAVLVNSYNAQRETKPSRASDAVGAADDEEGVTTMHEPQEIGKR